MISVKTKVCCLDLEADIIDSLKDDYDIYVGSAGKRVQVNNEKSYDYKLLLSNYDIPKNIHEYDVLIIDMDNFDTVPYNEEDNIRKYIIDHNTCFKSDYPTTIFDPVPLGYYDISEILKDKHDKPIIKIIFQNRKYDITYQFVENRGNGNFLIKDTFCLNNYSLIKDFAYKEIYGKEIFYCNDLARKLFDKFQDEITYNQTYRCPGKYDSTNNKIVDDPNFMPLLKNKGGQIVSYIYCDENNINIVLPQLQSKKELLKVLFNEFLFQYFPEYFPNNKAHSWTEEEEYFLPNHQKILDDKNAINQKYIQELNDIDNKINQNRDKYSFLHKILTETDNELVFAVIDYLKWLGFPNVIAKDSISKNGLFEEDIQIDLGERGLLIIEVKGIGGTSKDSECSQIQKIKFRRCEERCKFDVYALYIVNNERHLPPLKRTMPPFNPTQIQDAINEKRGLLSTWQLFNLFFNIENGLITKEEAREAFLENGLVEFKINNISELGLPYSYYMNDSVICIELNNQSISKGDFLFYETNGKYYKRQIIDIQKSKESLNSIDNGKVGIKLDISIPRNKKFYVISN
jgi:hypothetical protein